MSDKAKIKYESYDGYYDCGLPNTDGILRSGKDIIFGQYYLDEANARIGVSEKDLPLHYAPISWRVMDENDEYATLKCCYVISAKSHDTQPCNYESSELRKWLNDEFYNKAFNDICKQSIVPQNGDNVSLLTVEDSNDVAPVIKIKLGSEKNSRNKFQETAYVIKVEKSNGVDERIEYKCPCGKGKICSEAAWGFGDYTAWIECDTCAEKYNLYTGHGHLWELKEINKKK